VFLISIIFGGALLYFGAEKLVEGAEKLSLKYNIDPLWSGIFILAIGTSLPELATCAYAHSIGGQSPLILGNILGSNVANIALVLGICSFFSVVNITSKKIIKYDLAFLFVFTVISFFIFSNTISAVTGAIIISMYLVYLFYPILTKKQKNSETLDNDKSVSLNKAIISLLAGVILLPLGSKFLVSGSIEMAKLFNLNLKFVGLTVVAFATSGPELLTSILAARKNITSMAIGNVIGSNFFNFVIVGILSIFKPIESNTSIISIDSIIILSLTASLILFAIFKKKLDRSFSFFCLTAYIVYVFYSYYK